MEEEGALLGAGVSAESSANDPQSGDFGECCTGELRDFCFVFFFQKDDERSAAAPSPLR